MATDVVQPLSVIDAPLTGTVAVEASAGTGKTWTIAALVVRLVLDRALRIEDILVVTFTEAATAELRTRIRERLVALRARLASREAGGAAGTATIDPLLALTEAGGLGIARDECLRRLDAAINGFDLAPIHTIHAFCQRALNEHAFESGQAFACELVPDESDLVAASVADFWREATAGAPPAWSAWLRHKHVHPETLAELLIEVERKPYAGFVPPAVVAPPHGDLAGACVEAGSLWRSGSADVVRELQAMAAAGAAPRGWSDDALRQWCCDLDRYFGSGIADACVPEGLGKLLAARLPTTGPGVLRHPFFAAARRLVAAAAPFASAFAADTVAFKQRAVGAARRGLERRKRERSLVSYNDLVRHLATALEGPAGARLAASLRTRYRAVLVDEFQDTDPLQASLFTSVFGRDGDPLYFVGDPKQAIYGFRGADVRAYLHARARAERRTLLENFRSEPGLVAAVNTLFAGDDAFLVPSIGYSPASASPLSKACTTEVVLPESLAAPFTVWFAPRGDGSRAPKVGASRAAIAAAVAGEIAGLLEAGARGDARIGDEPLSGEHIAVLVKSHDQAALVRAALARVGVASVTYGQQSVFASPEAAELERVLLAVASPSQQGLVRAAHATDLLGWNANDFAALERGERPLEVELERFARYREIAERHDFALMLRTLAVEQRVAPRLLALADGERRLTNLLHLSELLEAAAARADLDLAGVVRRLRRARESPSREGENEQLRLESDEHLVRILTVHAAKGLQFPIVFCPFLWSAPGRKRPGQALAFHAPESGEAMFDLAAPPDDAHDAIARREALEESLRLAYVALTRAERRVVMVCGALYDWQASPLAWLLCRGVRAAPGKPTGPGRRRARAPAASEAPGGTEDRFDSVVGHAKRMRDAELRERLDALATASDGNIRLVDLPASIGARGVPVRPTEPVFSARRFLGRVPPRWRVASYSLLAARSESETPDHDALALPLPAVPAAATPAADALPRGARFGDALHHLFEHLDFTRLAQVEGQARDALVRFGLSAASGPALGRLAADVVRTPLVAEAPMRLADVPRARRVDELEFHLPIASIAPARLADALSELRRAAGLPAAPRDLVAAVAPGFLRGFVDLVFAADGRYWIADYKSTHLGEHREDYDAPALARAMSDHLYDLQALLYVLAVDRYLATRLPGYDYERHFGGVFYLFVRGMHPEAPGGGVQFLRPSFSLLAALRADLLRSGRLLP
jgi:exodeoxyribonuclease V beta subunit